MLTTDLVPAAGPRSDRLMVVLHGLGDSMEGYRWLPQMLRVPGLNYLLVNAPDDYYGGFSWYDFAGEPDPGIQRSRALLTSLLDEQRARGYPSERTWLFGFSQGCLMTLETGLRYPHRLAGLIGISGYLHDPDGLLAALPPVAREQRLLITHGRQDPMIPFHLVKRQVDQIRAAGLDVAWHEFDKAHGIAGDEELDVVRQFILNGRPRSSAP
jgi:phospholipase/carboxylesterase